mmetsp:Transcript_18256/g.28886  ORF Transcript_18256/g.28886 Transcript_18256/m.28886 type:complete len:220 (+) Transcript_18256:1524-2183(+)
MAIDCAHKPKGNDRHHDHGSGPTGKHPGQDEINPRQTQDQPGQRIAEEFVFLLIEARLAIFDLPFGCNGWQNVFGQRVVDFGRARGVVFGNVTAHRYQANAVFTTHGRKTGALLDTDDIGQRNIGSVRGAHLGPVEKISRQFTGGQFHPDLGAAGPVGIGRRLDPVQPVAQGTAQRIDGKAQVLPLCRQIKDQFLFVIGQIILDRADLRVLQQRAFQIL